MNEKITTVPVNYSEIITLRKLYLHATLYCTYERKYKGKAIPLRPGQVLRVPGG
jgi:hypothetical protein